VRLFEFFSRNLASISPYVKAKTVRETSDAVDGQLPKILDSFVGQANTLSAFSDWSMKPATSTQAERKVAIDHERKRPVCFLENEKTNTANEAKSVTGINVCFWLEFIKNASEVRYASAEIADANTKGAI
jgi:hypothetical protein